MSESMLANVSPQLAEEELSRIFVHPLFSSSPTLRRFLEFVVRKTVEGQSEQIKEYTIGAEVLGRGVSFDPRDSSIVRTQAFNLRTRLEVYYREAGSEAAFQIRLKPGNYVPVFISSNSLNIQTAPPAESRAEALRLHLISPMVSPPLPLIVVAALCVPAPSRVCSCAWHRPGPVCCWWLRGHC